MPMFAWVALKVGTEKTLVVQRNFSTSMNVKMHKICLRFPYLYACKSYQLYGNWCGVQYRHCEGLLTVIGHCFVTLTKLYCAEKESNNRLYI